MTRVAFYARYSSDNQNAASIEDQFRLCREQAEREGWTVAATYQDAAISGASVTLRPGMQALLQEAQAGRFDVVLAEALDRISRDQADVATLFKHLRFAGVEIVTVAEGAISELHVGLKGTMNALFLKDLAAKTHRGLRGRVEQGKSGGGLCYGYDVVKDLDTNGEPLRGGRTINQAEAEIVRRVFRDFAAGISPRALARRLNEDGVQGPTGTLWTDSTIRGHAKRGTGLINNELYIGRLVWNRLRYIKNPATGKRVSRINPPEEWIVKEVPELRIIDDELWQSVKDQQKNLASKYAKVINATRAAHANRLNQTHRPRALLSGLIFCGCCGGTYSLRGQDRYACSNHIMNGSCKNSRTIARKSLEERMLVGLRDRLMAPEVAAEAMRAYVEETNRLNRERRASEEADRKTLVNIEKKLEEIVAVIEDGGYSRALADRLRKLEAEQDELTERLSNIHTDIPDIHPNVAGVYRRKVERLAEALQNPQERDEAAAAIRGLIERITLSPGPKRGEIDATLHGDFRTILEWAVNNDKNQKTDMPSSGMSVSVVAGARN
ncbi:recombinase family protein [Hoeflea prorocentri]|uniref:Recombinase family protein n=2 Tax=Hoeflea prorocentri TaxID=1922333 RepID=A0A9X3UIR5_9HYPH|nr:recombinase family protein [Hoeflea prorocentri]MCY6379385.1 recombinase family protein [Hoeflea prorocentri]MDA5397186.1 recombinase family protein [Hoeflea prorocentri]